MGAGRGGGGSRELPGRYERYRRAIPIAASSSGATLCATPARSTATCGPPSSSFVTSSPVAACTSGGPAVNIEADSVMIVKLLSGAVSAP